MHTVFIDIKRTGNIPELINYAVGNRYDTSPLSSLNRRGPATQNTCQAFQTSKVLYAEKLITVPKGTEVLQIGTGSAVGKIFRINPPA